MTASPLFFVNPAVHIAPAVPDIAIMTQIANHVCCSPTLPSAIMNANSATNTIAEMIVAAIPYTSPLTGITVFLPLCPIPSPPFVSSYSEQRKKERDR